MTRWSRLTLAGALVGLVLGCSSEPSLPDLVGNWRATKFEFVSVANSSIRTDLTGLATLNMVVTATNATISGTITGQAPQTFFTATYTETATTLVLTGHDGEGNAQTLNFAMTLSGNTLTLTGATAEYDFGSGDVPATVNVVFTKQ